MDIRELSEVRRLDREIEKDRQRLEELEFGATDSQLFRKYGGRTAELSRDELEEQASALRAAVYEKQVWRIQEEKRLWLFISGMEDSYTRLIFALRFVDGESWEEIACAMKSTPEAVRKYFHRYLKSHPDLSLK